MRSAYSDARGPLPPSSRRGPSPASVTSHQYGQPPPPPPQVQGPGPVPAPGERRVVNPNWGGAAPSADNPPLPNAPRANPPSNGAPPFRPTSSPRNEVRSHDSRMPSPKSTYPQHQPPPSYPHHPEAPATGPNDMGSAPLTSGPPESAVQRPDERPPSVGPKRLREWEDEPSVKKQVTEENRNRLDDMRHRRPSTPPRDAYRRNSGDSRRLEDQRRVDEPKKEELRAPNDNYHPSEAAHHPQSHSVGTNQLPPMQPSSAPPNDKATSVPVLKEERPTADQASTIAATPAVSETAERAARKMDVDEDYDDSPEDEKKPIPAGNASGTASGNVDSKTTSPTSAGVNGSGAGKLE